MSTDRKRLGALASALESVDATRRPLFVEELISEIEEFSPGVASVSSLLARLMADPDPQLRDLVADLIERSSPYRGQQFESPARMLIDVLVLTIKEPELLACLEAFDLKETDSHFAPGHKFRYWTWASKGRTYAMANVGEAGNVYATLKMLTLSEHFMPRVAVLLGTAAGVPNKAKRGDVILANRVYNYEYAILTDEGLAQAAEPLISPLNDVDPLRAEVELKPWRAAVRDAIKPLLLRFAGPGEMPAEESLRGVPMALRVEPIMAGGWLIESNALTAFARSIQANIVASEMDGAGFAIAAKHLGWPWYVVRGIADSGAPGRDQEWQRFATYAAAIYARDVLLKHVFAVFDDGTT